MEVRCEFAVDLRGMKGLNFSKVWGLKCSGVSREPKGRKVPRSIKTIQGCSY